MTRDHYLRTLPGAAGPRYLTRLDVVLRTDPFDPASIATLAQIEQWLADALPRVPTHMGWVQPEVFGQTVHVRDLAQVIGSDRQRVNLLVLVGIFLILLVVVERAWIAAYLLFTVVLSYYATLGATALMASWWWGREFGPLDWRVPFYLFIILAAVGEDYNILLVTRMIDERRDRGDLDGARHALARTGGTISACGVIMAGTFATLMLGGLNTLVQIGFALAFGVLLDTFIVRPFLVPSFLIMVWRMRSRPAPIVVSEPEETRMPLRRSA
jgi:RND superfamily putative drug exporter